MVDPPKEALRLARRQRRLARPPGPRATAAVGRGGAGGGGACRRSAKSAGNRAAPRRVLGGARVLGRERARGGGGALPLERALPEQAAARIQAQLRAMGARHEASARRREKAAAVHVADAAAERAAASRVACVVDWQRKVAATVGQRYARGWLARARAALGAAAGARTAAAQKERRAERRALRALIMRLDREAAATRIAAAWRAQRTRDEPAVQVVRKRAATRAATRGRVRRLEGAASSCSRWARHQDVRGVEARRMCVRRRHFQGAQAGGGTRPPRISRVRRRRSASLQLDSAAHCGRDRPARRAARGACRRGPAASEPRDQCINGDGGAFCAKRRARRSSICAWQPRQPGGFARARREANVSRA